MKTQPMSNEVKQARAAYIEASRKASNTWFAWQKADKAASDTLKALENAEAKVSAKAMSPDNDEVAT